ncbi:alcohol dehydrogenase catalytic domain-containing protein [Paenibacillus sp. PAMC21692]|uniref:alcohol dehydrogenase catalytic domain-containing protein n=1 Tax=Paenibacillus sp. PAMC21692 TaxID=2762320 RepID=UPI00164E4C83|nr:alcohol dehydrogenase catalytic domain-containing protein [Paenibacillus sp. PAMC21692]QNK59431.1 alcohol dehydrogenase catalytic domain-containing protein [Paenibacillus sp. PAMC21692]
MKAIHIAEPLSVKTIDASMPEPQGNEALIRVKSAGICGSDIGAYRGVNPLVSYPRTIGHEIAGEVVAIPPNVKGIRLGDKVIVDPYLYCGQCYPCAIGRTNCCERLQVLGVHVDGGMSDYFRHPVDMLVKAPDDMAWDVMCMAEPLTIALHGLHRTRLRQGEHIAIIGAGAIGLLAAMAAIQYGAVPIVIDIVQARLEQARAMGVQHVVNSSSENAEEAIRRITGGRKAEVVLEASGANAAVRMTLDLVSHAGRIGLTGWPKQETPLPTDWITRKEVDIVGCRTSAGEFEEAVELIHSRKVDVRKLITATVPMDEAARTIQEIERNPDRYLKVIVML